MNAPTDVFPIQHFDPNFEPQDKRLCWKDDHGKEHWTQLYTPSDEALSWDGAPDGVNAAMGSRFGAYLYVKVEETGRKDTPVLGSRSFGALMGRRVKITFTEVSFDDGIRFTDTATGWVAPNPES